MVQECDVIDYYDVIFSWELGPNVGIVVSEGDFVVHEIVDNWPEMRFQEEECEEYHHKDEDYNGGN